MISVTLKVNFGELWRSERTYGLDVKCPKYYRFGKEMVRERELAQVPTTGAVLSEMRQQRFVHE